MKKKPQVFKIEFKNGPISKTYFVDKSSFVLGRGDNSEIKIDDNNVSREHLKIFLDEERGMCIQDLGSGNGTYLGQKLITTKTVIQIKDNDHIALGKSQISFRICLFSIDEKVQDFSNQLQDKQNINKITVEVSGYPPADVVGALDFKNVGFDLPKYKDANEHAVEIIREAEFVRQSILTYAEAQKEKILNETRIESKKIADETYAAYLKNAQILLDEAKKRMQHLQIETKTELDQKRIDALNEIKIQWGQHEAELEVEKKSVLEKLKQENQLKLTIEFEQQKNDLFIEKDKILRNTELELEIKSKKQKAQLELEKNEHDEKLNLVNLKIEGLEKANHKLEDANAELIILKSESENQIDQLSSQIRILTEQHQDTQKKFDGLSTEYLQKSVLIESFRNDKNAFTLEKQNLETEIENLIKNRALAFEKKNNIEAALVSLTEEFNQAKIKNKALIELEFSNLKKSEQEKFDTFKSSELKDLQKIREQHSESIKKLSIDLSQEIATTLELQSKKTSTFDFEKNFEIINSIIQVKSSAITGSESKHKLQLDNWKKRQNVEKTKLIFTGFASAFAAYFIFNFVSAKFSQDSLQIELREIASIRSKKEIENKYIPVKSAEFHDTYVQSTIFTENFIETYLNEKYQKEWVKFATVYFLNKWKVPEENTIKVISNSKALVQNIQEAIPKLKKDRFKNDIENLNEIEKTNVDEQAKILGTYVKYEAYKKLEKDFFVKKMNLRSSASEK